MVLGLQECNLEEVTMKDAINAYRRNAKKIHPDKAGDSFTAAFQELVNSYRRVLEYLYKRNKDTKVNDDYDDVEKFSNDNFENFNFPHENKGSFTVHVEDSKADTWEECIQDILGAPTIERSNGVAYGKYWKVTFACDDQKGELTIHFYNKPKTKKKKSSILIQGSNQHLISLYVFEELPKIYKIVCNKIPALMTNGSVRKTRSSNLVECGLCKKESTVQDMKKHMKSVHTDRTPAKKRKLTHAKESPIAIVEALLIEDISISEDMQVNLEESLDINDEIQCDWDPCDYKSKNKSKLVEHIDSHLLKTNNAQKPVLCDLKSCDKCDFDVESGSELTEHMKEKHKVEEFYCSECRYQVKDKSMLETHIKEIHITKSDKAVESQADATCICGECGKYFDNFDECNEHIKSHCNRCYKCEYECEDKQQMKKHERSEHDLLKCKQTHEGKCKPMNNQLNKQESFTCEECTAEFQNSEGLRKHILTHKKTSPSQSGSTNIKCDQCSHISEDVSSLVKHIRTNHKAEHCQFCEHVAENKETLQNHMMEKHGEVVILHTMAQQVDHVSESFVLFEKFKDELGNVLKSILDTQNAVKQELFLIRNKQTELSSLVIQSHCTAAPSRPDQQMEAPAAERLVPPPPPPSRAAPTPPPPSTTPHQRQEKSKILFVGDSISRNVDISTLEDATQSKIVTARAYSAVHDTVRNVAKQAARFPNSNFTDVVPAELSKANYQSLVLQAGSVDITNLDTKNNPSKHLEYFRQETVKSANSFFQTGVNAISAYPSLEKVVLMKQVPRYDPANVDPLAIKPALSQLYDNTITDLWMTSKHKGKIAIGSHNIACTGAIKEARYRETKTGKYDGIHLYGSSGRKAYTQSVLNIMKWSELTSSEYEFHLSCAQHKYQQIQNRNRQGGNKRTGQNRRNVENAVFTVPTQNRFDRLSGCGQNQGNW